MFHSASPARSREWWPEPAVLQKGGRCDAFTVAWTLNIRTHDNNSSDSSRKGTIGDHEKLP